MTKTGTPTLGERIRRHRGEHRLSQRQLADKAGVDLATISRIESGTIRRPQVVTIAGLARALGVDPSELEEVS